MPETLETDGPWNENTTLDDIVLEYKPLKYLKKVKARRGFHITSSTQAILPNDIVTEQTGKYNHIGYHINLQFFFPLKIPNVNYDVYNVNYMIY